MRAACRSLKPASSRAPFGRVEMSPQRVRQVDILSEAHGRPVDSAHPGGDRVASDDRVGDAGSFQGRCRASKRLLTSSTARSIHSHDR